MLIRSQNKEVLAVFENLLDVEVSGVVISVRKDNGWYYLLGEYSTKAKALKVLDMIQEAYSEYQIMLNFSVSYLHEFKEKIDGFAIFQMPDDSEVEV